MIERARRKAILMRRALAGDAPGGNSVPCASTAIGAPLAGAAATLFQESANIAETPSPSAARARARRFIQRRNGRNDPKRWMG